jgi:hypothetical protein
MFRRFLRRRLKLVLLAALTLTAVAVWTLYPRPSDADLIAELIRRGEHGIETKNTKEIMGCVAPDYHDSQNVTRTELLRLVMQWARVRERGEVTIEDYHLEITPPSATGTFAVTFVLAGEGGRRTPLPMQLTMQFEEHPHTWRDEWLVRSVEGYSVGSMMEGVE